ncbi:Transposon TX1 uncharacterized 82 kDa protein ORF 1, partial [Takifugu flavidus]
MQPAARITLSKVLPFVSNKFLARELSRHGKLVSPIRKLLSGCKSPLLRHVVSHRRQVHMVLNNRAEEVNYCFVVHVDDFDYILFATSSALMCFNCGEEGHLGLSDSATGAAASDPALALRRRWCSAEGAPAVLDGAQMESKAEGAGDSGDKKAGRLEDAATATDTSNHEYTSDGSKLSNMVVYSERDDLYPPSMLKSFLTQTKGMRGPDLGIYFPDKLLFIQSASHWIKHRV